MDFITITGVFGAGIILFAFIMNQNGKWQNDSFWYDFFNLVGSVVMIIYASLLNSVPFIILNVVWGGYSLKDVISKLLSKK